MTEPLALQTDVLASLDVSPSIVPPDPAPQATAAISSPPPAPEAGGSASGASPAPAPAITTPTWRDAIAADDKAFLKTLDKYSDAAAFGRAHRSLLQKLSSGELKAAPQPFPEKGTDAEKAAWKAANGVPEKPEQYAEKMTLPKGVVFGDADKPGLERLSAHAAKSNWSQSQFDAVIGAYHAELEASTNARQAADDAFHQQSEDALRSEWGNDFRRNVNAIQNMLNGAPEGVRDRLMGGRTADGKIIGDDPAVLKWWAQLSLDLNPAATILPAGMSAEGAKSRLDTLIAMSKEPMEKSEYWTGPNAKALQKEHLDLLTKQEAMSARGRAA